MTDDEFNPDWRSPPGDTIKELIEEGRIGRVGLGARLFLSPSELDDLLEGRLPLNEELADRLALVFGTSSDFWINRERHYREPITLPESFVLPVKRTPGMKNLLPLAEPVEVDGEIGIRLGDEVFKVQKMKPWDEMSEEERREHIARGVDFIMGGSVHDGDPVDPDA